MDNSRAQVFISYAHRDNQPFASDKGWVTLFDEALRAYLGQRLGADPIVWRDTRMQGNSALSPEIEEGLTSSAALISVLSPSYVNSDWCKKELDEFCKSAKSSGGLLVNNTKSRVFKVIKLPPENLEILPDELKEVLDYPFYQNTKDGDYAFELNPESSEEDRQLFIRAVGRLSADAARLIKDFKQQTICLESAPVKAESQPSPASLTHVKIFLADCASDRREEKERLLSDLKQSGYTVLPDRPLPLYSADEYCKAVQEILNSCHVCIQLIGSRYGTVPDSEGAGQKSVVVLQNEIAAKRSASGKLRRVIWLPASTKPKTEQQESFINQLRHDPDAQEGADLLSGDFEQLRTTVHLLVKASQSDLMKPPAVAKHQQDGSNIRAYLVCTQEDRKRTIPLRKYLKQQGIDIELPLFNGDSQELRNANQDLICRCQGLLTFYGAGEEAWFRAIRSDHRKIGTYRVGLPPIPQYLYLAEPDTPEKQDMVDMEEPYLIDGRIAFDADLLRPFIQAIKAGQKQA
jgi:hypothetical protein